MSLKKKEYDLIPLLDALHNNDWDIYDIIYNYFELHYDYFEHISNWDVDLTLYYRENFKKYLCSLYNDVVTVTNRIGNLKFKQSRCECGTTDCIIKYREQLGLWITDLNRLIKDTKQEMGEEAFIQKYTNGKTIKCDNCGKDISIWNVYFCCSCVNRLCAECHGADGGDECLECLEDNEEEYERYV